MKKIHLLSFAFLFILNAIAQQVPNGNFESWTYNDSMQYGSGENEKRVDEISSVKLSADGKSITVEIPLFASPEKIIDRIYRIQLPTAKKLFGDSPSRDSLDFYQTVRAVPAAK